MICALAKPDHLGPGSVKERVGDRAQVDERLSQLPRPLRPKVFTPRALHLLDDRQAEGDELLAAVGDGD